MNIESDKLKKYTDPIIQQIDLDNQIALAMESNPTPEGDPSNWGVSYNGRTELGDPFKNLAG